MLTISSFASAPSGLKRADPTRQPSREIVWEALRAIWTRLSHRTHPVGAVLSKPETTTFSTITFERINAQRPDFDQHHQETTPDRPRTVTKRARIPIIARPSATSPTAQTSFFKGERKLIVCVAEVFYAMPVGDCLFLASSHVILVDPEPGTFLGSF